MKRDIRLIAASILFALAPLASPAATDANSGQSLVANRLAASFSTMAGSTENALALVNALRNGTPVTLVAAPATTTTTTTGTTTGFTTGTTAGTPVPVETTFTPPTKPMGWGNVAHALSLAQFSLAQAGITNPTNAQLQAALMGGDVTAADGSTVTLKGILQMRADGMGWGQIAKASGTTMGAVVSSTKAMQGRVATTTPTSSATTAAGATTTAKSAKGITTAAGTGGASAVDKSSKGITTASGATTAAASRGLVTAEGGMASPGRSGGVTTAASGSGGGNAFGRGLVTASGGSVGAGVASAAAQGHGVGLVSGTGASASSNASITSAAGPGNGHGQGAGNGKGKGG